MKFPTTDRRKLLQHLGLFGAATILPSLRPRQSAAASARPPKRIIFFSASHGTIRNLYTPTGSGGGQPTEMSFTLGPLHQPMVPWQARMIFTKGIDMTSSHNDPTSASGHILGNSHALVGRRVLNDTLAGAGGISLDQYIAKQLNAEAPITRFPSLELGATEFGGFIAGMSFSGPNQMLPVEVDPAKTYSRVFANVVPAAAGAPDPNLAKQAAVGKSVLDYVVGELQATSPKLGKTDRARLDAHASAIRDLEKRFANAPTVTAGCHPPDKNGLAVLSNHDAVTVFNNRCDLHLQIMAAAFACDLTRVIAFHLSDAGDGGSLDMLYGGYKDGDFGSPNLHDLVHKVGMGLTDPGAIAAISNGHVYQMKKLAQLCSLLNAIPESDGGTLLDHTLILYHTEIAEGNHDRHQLPWFTVGGNAHLRTGRYLQFSGTPHQNLLVSLANYMDVPMNTFGDPASCSGPLAGFA